MEQTVNDCRDNLLVRVREYYPEIKPEEYQLLVYLTSGLSARTISLLLGESVDVIYKRKSRLKSRLKETVAPACPDIMEIF
jgi:DNA-binding CsgD family transcriptional regulator